MIPVRALVITGYGLNCDYETDFSLKLGGAESCRVHINELIAGVRSGSGIRLDHYHIMVFGGGFSFGLGSGWGWGGPGYWHRPWYYRYGRYPYRRYRRWHRPFGPYSYGGLFAPYYPFALTAPALAPTPAVETPESAKEK